MDTPKEPRLLLFTGRECPHCLRMAPIVAEVERESGRPILEVEVWHDEEHAKLMEESYGDALRAACGGLLGVPAFYNEDTGEALCGEVDKDVLLAWASRTSPADDHLRS